MSEFTFHMGEASLIFSALKTEQKSRSVLNEELGPMGATVIETFDSKLGGTLEMQTSMGGCTLKVKLK